MRIAAIGIEDKTSASRRIRYKTFLANLPEGYRWHKWEKGLNCDLLYIQKLLRPWTIAAAAKAYIRGMPVVFDLDDIRENWKDKPYDDMLRYCAAITTDTEDKAAELRKHTALPVHVVPDTIDYGAVTADSIQIRPSIKRIVTFGRWQNVAAAAHYFDALADYDMSYICDRPLKPLDKHAHLVKWNASTFIKELRKYDLAIIAHHPHWAVNMKSNNRLLVCMAIGLPVIVSPSKEYDKTLADADMNGLLTGLCESFDHNRLREAMMALESQSVRTQISSRFIAYARKYHHPSIAGRMLAEVFNSCVASTK